jgi:hypothetical protein
VAALDTTNTGIVSLSKNFWMKEFSEAGQSALLNSATKPSFVTAES